MRRLCSVAFILTFGSHAFAGDTKSVHELSPLFRSDEILDLTLKSSLRYDDIMKKRNLEPRNATIYYEWSGKPVRAAVQVQLRGMSRLYGCDFAPFKLYPLKNENPLFDGIGKAVKAVTQCYRGGLNSEMSQVILNEYMVYKMVEATGFPAFRTRLARIKYLMPNGKLLTTQYAFFIESRKHLVKRDRRVADMFSYAKYREMDKRKFVYGPNYNTAVYLAERLVLNEDFGAFPMGSQNTDTGIFKNGKYFEVPYDFDLSAFVGRGLMDIPNDHDSFLANLCGRRDCRLPISKLIERESAIVSAVQKAPLVKAEVKTLTLNFVRAYFVSLRRWKASHR